MRIDFIISSLTGGGAERVMVLLANGFSEKKYTVSIITFDNKTDYQTDNNVNRVFLNKGIIRNQTIRRLIELTKYYSNPKNRPDLIISFLPPINFVTIIVSKLYRIKIIVSEHINHLQEGSVLDKFTRTKLYRFANLTTILTKFDIDYYKKAKANVVVMPNPCSFKPININNHKRRNTILAVGSLNRIHHKGFDNLLDLMVPILKENPEWKLLIAGEGKKGFVKLQSQVTENKIENQVEFLGFVSDINEIMKYSKIFVLTSRFEGLPMVILEAMSQGMACIAYDCKTGPSDLIRNGHNGLLIPDQDKSSMQLGLNDLIHDDHLREKISNNALDGLNQYSLENILLKWEQIFDEITLK
jgi:GalNAc-alpha-(1->4)-GalNAc-alpha-(1->3)-diNAcBac-PP-undecaprenol alpha-1,4-N-acetyl-D-galactosaminyltransferase